MASNLNVNDPKIKPTQPGYNYDKVCDSLGDTPHKNEDTKQEKISTPPLAPTPDPFQSIQTFHDQPKLVRPTALYPELPRLDSQTANPIWPSGNDIIRPEPIKPQPFAYPVTATYAPSAPVDDLQLQRPGLNDDTPNTRFYTLRRKRAPHTANHKNNDC